MLDDYPKYFGEKVTNEEFPILVKFIDAQKDLSVQVHPSDVYAQKNEWVK
ncbi:type I phosphomannose isomerase catalytic subunit [Enterococcus faecium]